MARRENKVEDYLKKRMEEIGGAAEKHVNPGANGDPDRLCSFPDGYHCLVETKWAQDVLLPAHQSRRHKWWRLRGMDVYVIPSVQQASLWVTRMARLHAPRHPSSPEPTSESEQSSSSILPELS